MAKTAYGAHSFLLKVLFTLGTLLCTALVDGWFQYHRFMDIKDLSVNTSSSGLIFGGSLLPLAIVASVILCLIFAACKVKFLVAIFGLISAINIIVSIVIGCIVKYNSLKSFDYSFSFDWDLDTPNVVITFDTSYMLTTVLCVLLE